MQIRQLEMFRYTMKYGTISEAAKIMNISQPSASRLIGELEQSLGFLLFIRTKGRLNPSPEGLKFYQEVEKTFGILVSLEQYAAQLKKNKSDSLRIAVTPALSTVFAPNIIKIFQKDYPDARISLMAHSPSIIFDMLEREDIDLAFNNKMVTLPTISEDILIDASFICVMQSNHRLAKKHIITPEDLDGENFIELVNEGSVFWKLHADLFKKFNIKTNNLYSTQRAPSAYGMVAAGLGIGLFEPFSYTAWKGNNIIARPFLPKLTYSYAAYYPTGRIRSEFARAFVNAAKFYIKNNPLPFADIYNGND